METPTEQVEIASPSPFEGIEVPVEEYIPLPGPNAEAAPESTPVVATEPERPANGKKPHHAYGDPTKPLWKDIVGDMSNSGALSKAQWEASVLWLVKPFAVRNEWSGRELVQKAVRAIRRMTDRYPKVGEVLALWDAMPQKKRNRVMSLDAAVAEVDGISKDEMAGLILAGMKQEAFATAKAIQAAALPDLMAASMDAGSGNGASSASERVRHLETMGVIKQSKGQQININASASASGEKVVTQSFDSQLTELDNALDADYQMLPAAQPKQLNE